MRRSSTEKAATRKRGDCDALQLEAARRRASRSGLWLRGHNAPSYGQISAKSDNQSSQFNHFESPRAPSLRPLAETAATGSAITTNVFCHCHIDRRARSFNKTIVDWLIEDSRLHSALEATNQAVTTADNTSVYYPVSVNRKPAAVAPHPLVCRVTLGPVWYD